MSIFAAAVGDEWGDKRGELDCDECGCPVLVLNDNIERPILCPECRGLEP